MSDDSKHDQNNFIKEQINESETSSKISNNKNKEEDLIKRLKEVHCKSKEKTFDLNEKFNQINNR